MAFAKRLIAIIALVLFAPMANAQNASTTIAVTNTFQVVYMPNTIRLGCTIQNNGTHTMYVFFGPIASATLTNTAQVAPGNPIYCNTGNTVLPTQVSITGTSGDAFYANAW